VKERGRQEMKYKKPMFLIIIAAVVTCIAVAVCFLTNQKDSDSERINPFGKYHKVDEDDSVKSTATKWFDSLQGSEILWNDVREINLDAYPDVTFRCYAEKLEAVTDKETVSLYAGMPIWNVYFCDFTGDGKPELCSTISIGSGIIDNRVIIYDYAEGVSYELSDRMNYDYVLNMKNGKMIAEKRKHMQEELVLSGELVFKDGIIQIQSDN